MDKRTNIISAAITIIIGLLLMILQGRVISIVLTVCAVAVLVSAVMDFIGKKMESGAIKAVIGVCILIFGWAFVELAFYILAAAIIIMGITQIINIRKYGPHGVTVKDNVFIYGKSVLTVIAGACLLFNQGGAINGVFIATGILLIVEGVMELIAAAKY